MPPQPAADILIDGDVVAGLARIARANIVDAPPVDPVWATAGWDCSVWRWGDALALRLPRRTSVAHAVAAEQHHLPGIQHRLARTGLLVPAPVYAGRPTEDFPWPWSVVPWAPGTAALGAPRAERTTWAARLADALSLLHAPAESAHPVNPFRGVPLVARDEAFTARHAELARGGAPEALLATTAVAWREGRAAPTWTSAPVWLHGDLHPGNLIVDDGRLTAIIDWIDLTAGDPAGDLAVAWLVFDAAGRADFIGRLDHDVATWARARAWAAYMCVVLMSMPADDPLRALAEATAAELG